MIQSAIELDEEELAPVFTILETLDGLQQKLTQQALSLLAVQLGDHRSFIYQDKFYQLRCKHKDGADFYFLCEMKEPTGPKKKHLPVIHEAEEADIPTVDDEEVDVIGDAIRAHLLQKENDIPEMQEPEPIVPPAE